MNGTEHTEDGNEEQGCAKAESAEARELREQMLFIEMFNNQQTEVHQTALNKGWWDSSDDFRTATALIREHVPDGASKEQALEAVFNLGKRNDGEMLCLMHSELSEALEALRHGNPPDDKCPEFDSLTVELADVLIRMMDFAEYHRLPLARAVIAKMDMNRGRPHMHGGKRF